MSRFLLLLTASLLPATAAAQDAPAETPQDAAPSSTEQALEEIIAGQEEAAPQVPSAPVDPVDPASAIITVTATGLATTTKSTGQAVTVIERAEIEDVQGADPVRVLRRTPGLGSARNGGPGSFTGVSVRGARSEQLLVLIDGVRVSDPASPSGGFDFGTLVTGTIGKFDLLRGSNSTIWGSEAIGGVLDISTRGDEGVQASAEYGSRDTLFASASGGLEGESYFLGLAGSYFGSDGFSSAASGIEADGFEQRDIASTAFVDIAPSLEAFAHARWGHSDVEIDGFPAPAFALADTLETQETRRYSGDLGLAYYGNDLTLRGAYSLADTERENFDPAFGDAPLFASDGHSDRLSLRGEYRLLGGLSVAFGGEHEWTSYRTSFDDGADTEISGGYVQLGWVMGRLAAHVGSRIDHHQLFGTNGSYGADISYGFGRDWRVRASLGEGFKAPTLFQLFSEFGNRRLRPEESTSFDVGVEKGQRGQGLHLAATVFRRDSEDLIGFTSCFGVTGGICTGRPFGTYDNIARARAQGIELEAGGDLAEGLRLSGVYSLIDSEDGMSGNDLARRPRHMATLFADYTAPFGLEIGADLRIVSDSFDDAANAVPIDGYELFDLRAVMPISDRFEIFGRVENAFDTDYQTAAGYASSGRGAFIGVRAKL